MCFVTQFPQINMDLPILQNFQKNIRYTYIPILLNMYIFLTMLLIIAKNSDSPVFSKPAFIILASLISLHSLEHM